MFDFSRFQDVFPSGAHSPYDKKSQQEIEAHRKTLDGALFIDRVLKALGITKAKVYPPKTDNALKQLHQQICEAGMSMHHKLSLFYYVLLDFETSKDAVAVAENFAAESGMPKNYQIFMKGLWYLDQEDFQRALEYIAHPSLIPDFADDIITVLIRQAPSNDYSLALTYFYTVQPILKTSSALELLFDAMARTNVMEALIYSRTHPEHTREVLFTHLVAAALSDGRGQGLANRASELAFLPFDSAEERWFDQYLTSGNGRNLRKAKDTLLIRKIASDRFVEVSKERAGGQWGGVLEGIKAGIEGHVE